MEKIAILGAGAMGTAMAIYLAKKGHEVNLWGTHVDKDVIKTMIEMTSGECMVQDVS